MNLLQHSGFVIEQEIFVSIENLLVNTYNQLTVNGFGKHQGVVHRNGNGKSAILFRKGEFMRIHIIYGHTSQRLVGYTIINTRRKHLRLRKGAQKNQAEYESSYYFFHRAQK